MTNKGLSFQDSIKLLGFLGLAVVAGYLGATLRQSPDAVGAISSPDERFAYFAQNRGSSPAEKSTFPDFVVASAVSTPCVVYIKTTSQVQSMSFQDWFFGGGGGKQVSTGSGVIYSADGYIITNNHVISEAEKIEVVHEKQTYKAKVIGKDANSDLAVLKIEASGLPFIKISDSHAVRVGEWVVAVGNPFNLTSTVTVGVVSAKGRNLNLSNSLFPIESFIQTDAAINPGNSGGALVNTKGELVGINTAIYSQTGSYTGYGFAVPSDIVTKVVRDLIKYGEVQKAFAGIETVDIDNNLANRLDLPDYNGVVISSVSEGSAAEKAGLKTDDVILKVDQEKINSKSSLDEELSYRDPGNKIKITYRRGSSTKETILTLTNSEGTTSISRKEIEKNDWLKASFVKLSKIEKDKLRLTSGIRATSISSESILRQLSVSENEIVITINYQAVNSGADIEEALKKARGRLVIELMDARGNRYNRSFFF